VSASPTGCARCHARLIAGLDRYRATQDYAVVDDLAHERCECSPESVFDAPLSETDASIASSILERYANLARSLGLNDEWREYEPRLTPAIHGAFAGYVATRQESASLVG